jgi:SAM-dependent methyltransferase
MTISLHQELHRNLLDASPARLSFTRKAYQMLPTLDRPRVLDIGCGRGGPTLELARLSGGEVVGLDIDQPSLDELATRIEEAGLWHRVWAVNGSLLAMDFPAESFDILWSEGSIQFIGFERGLAKWRRFIKPCGFLVVHVATWLRPDPPAEIVRLWASPGSATRTAAEYIAQIPTGGYDLIGHFALPADFWWLDYYLPLQERVIELRKEHLEDREVREALERQQREIDVYRSHARWAGSAYYLMQKRDDLDTVAADV